MIKGNSTRVKYLKRWTEYLPKNPTCEICGKKLFYFSGDNKKSVCFDHKNGKLPIKENPSSWTRQREPTHENIGIWNKCNFGVLCNQCNRRLPTKNREEWIKKVTKYIFKENYLKVVKNCKEQLHSSKLFSTEIPDWDGHW